MINFIIGAIVIGVLWLVVEFARKKALQVTWWQWLLTALGLLFAGLTLAALAALIGEGALKAALVVGGIMVLVAVVWGVLMGRFVFLRASR